MTADRPDTKPPKSNAAAWQPPLLFLAAVTLFYLSFTPGTIEGMGYNGENLTAADQIVTNLFNLARRQPLVTMEWTRHGGLELLFELPFAFASRLLFGPSVKWMGRLMSLQPILATSLLCTLLLVWMRRLSGSWGTSYALAAVAAFTTLLWPYAYIGLETTQSLCLLAAAYLAIGRTPRHTWPEVLALGAFSACALALKLTGLYMLPAVAYLNFRYFTASVERPRNSRVMQLLVTGALVITVFGLNYYLKVLYWSRFPGGSIKYFLNVLVDSPLTAIAQALSFFGSVNKSLLLFAPVVALSLLRLPQTYRAQPYLVTFALLVLGGLVGGHSLVMVWAEETWGPRYLHSAIAPLVICLASAWNDDSKKWRGEKFLLPATALLGLLINLPGVLVPYTSLHLATIRSEHSTLPALQYDPRFNHVRFNYHLLQIWLATKAGGAQQPVWWPPPTRWWFERPAALPAEQTVDLREWALPQPVLLKAWTPTLNVSPGIYLLLRIFLFFSLCASLVLFVWQSRRLGKSNEKLLETAPMS